ncbi:hypothetical protein [Litorisediminicola beolgyonensis]|uniref:Uncharacterized protein n=1 Tax=Litorisediminicola beolgyonensis TaxID=1173614 RepID=A0ABW3ZLA1_9RHOB
MVHYLLTVAKFLVLTPGIVLAITGQGEGLAKLGSVLTVLSMALFAFVVLRKGVGTTDTAQVGTNAQPAE